MKLLELRTDTHADIPSVMLATDSMIVSRRLPVFLPEISERWLMEISAAYRIGRLGKTIAARFAHRYIDGMTLVARFVPVDLVERLAAIGEARSPLATAFDGALAVGSWTAPAEEFAFALASPAAEAPATVRRSPAEAVETLSRSFILKTGDIVVAGNPIVTLPVGINTRVEASIGDDKVLTFNIK